MHTTETPGGGYEKRDAQIRPLVDSGVLLVVLCLGSFWSMIYVHDWLKGMRADAAVAGSALAPARDIPPPPLLEQAAHLPVNWAETKELEKPFFKSSGLSDVRADESAKLNTYYWIDKQAKIVHVPIQQAMQRLLEQGLPTRK